MYSRTNGRTEKLRYHTDQCFTMWIITRSDAERLVSMLLDRNPPLASLSGFRAKVTYPKRSM